MVYWVWDNCRRVADFSDIIIATDDERIAIAVQEFGAKAILTPSDCSSPTERTYIVSRSVNADFYVMVNGDEPLVRPETISAAIPEKLDPNEVAVTNLMYEVTNPIDVVDATNIKVVTDDEGFALYISRSPIPYPKGSSDFIYHKFVGITGFTKPALEFYHSCNKGILEKAEDVDELRFVEHGKKVKFINVTCDSLSVDTPKDVETVEKKMNKASPKCKDFEPDLATRG